MYQMVPNNVLIQPIQSKYFSTIRNNRIVQQFTNCKKILLKSSISLEKLLNFIYLKQKMFRFSHFFAQYGFQKSIGANRYIIITVTK